MKYKTVKSETNLYFVSSVITQHKILFTEVEIAMIPLNSLNWFRDKNLWKLFSFCLMPNHIHFIIKLLNSSSIEGVLAKFHSFTGHQIVNYLKENNKKKLLDFFRKAAANKKPDREFLIWEDSVVKIVENEKTFIEFIEYIHNNPVT